MQAAMYQDFFRATNAGHDIASDDMQKAIGGLQTVSAELEKLQQQARDDEDSSTFSRFNKDFVLTMFAKCNCELSRPYLWRANRRTPWDYQNIPRRSPAGMRRGAEGQYLAARCVGARLAGLRA